MKANTHKPKDKRKLMIRLVCLLLCFLMVSGLVSAAVMIMAEGASSSEIQKELDALKKQAAEIAAEGAALEEELAANAEETKTTIQKKVEIDRQISITEAQIRNTNEQIQQYNLLIAEKQKQLDESEEELAQMNERYKARIRAMEESGSISYWSVLFQANSFSDLLSRLDSIHEIAAADRRMLKEMSEMSAQIAEDREELEQERAELADTMVYLTELEGTLAEQRAEADALLIELGSDREDIQAEYEANAAREAELQAQLIQTQVDYEAALSAEQRTNLAQQNQNNVAGGGTVSGGGSGFTNPLGYMTVTCAFGPRIHPLWGTQSNHTGVDLAASQGTPIYAIASGTVTAAGYSDAYGYNVTLAHGNGYGSMYAHMTNYIVSVGQSVTQGQIIGYVGSTGWSTGPHLHFEIYVNGAPVNPMLYVG